MESVVDELNISLADTGLRLELLRWETHSRPEIGADPQAVLNAQLTDDYDVFLGILWHRFGSPTPRAESGTAEEFQRAYARHQHDPSSCLILFYFKEAAVSLSEVEPTQLAAVQDFRKRLGGQGLYAVFKGTEEFTRLARIHLTKVVLEWRRRQEDAMIRAEKASLDYMRPDSVNISESVALESDDGAGFLDLVARGKNCFDELTRITARLNQGILDLNSHTEQRQAELQSLNEQHGGAPVDEARRVINSVAQRLDYFADLIASELTPFRAAAQDGFEAISRAAQMLLEIAPVATTEVSTVAATVRFISAQAEILQDSLRRMKQSILALPRMTSPLNHAKRRSSQAIEALEDEVRATQLLALETAQLLDDLVKDRPS